MRKESWISPTKKARATFTDRKSVFIADIAPIHSTGDAEELILSAKGEFPDARHHVYAWRFFAEDFFQRFSDDGEPAGTAGLPVLDTLRKNSIEDAGIVVTRYFGGVLLGTGGLVRAYSKAACMALNESCPARFVHASQFRINVSYAFHDKLRYNLRRAGFLDSETHFTDEAEFLLCGPCGTEEEMQRICMDTTAGSAGVLYIKETVMRADESEELTYEI